MKLERIAHKKKNNSNKRRRAVHYIYTIVVCYQLELQAGLWITFSKTENRTKRQYILQDLLHLKGNQSAFYLYLHNIRMYTN